MNEKSGLYYKINSNNIFVKLPFRNFLSVEAVHQTVRNPHGSNLKLDEQTLPKSLSRNKCGDGKKC